MHDCSIVKWDSDDPRSTAWVVSDPPAAAPAIAALPARLSYPIPSPPPDRGAYQRLLRCQCETPEDSGIRPGPPHVDPRWVRGGSATWIQHLSFRDPCTCRRVDPRTHLGGRISRVRRRMRSRYVREALRRSRWIHSRQLIEIATDSCGPPTWIRLDRALAHLEVGRIRGLDPGLDPVAGPRRLVAGSARWTGRGSWGGLRARPGGGLGLWLGGVTEGLGRWRASPRAALGSVCG